MLQRLLWMGVDTADSAKVCMQIWTADIGQWWNLIVVRYVCRKCDYFVVSVKISYRQSSRAIFLRGLWGTWSKMKLKLKPKVVFLKKVVELVVLLLVPGCRDGGDKESISTVEFKISPWSRDGRSRQVHAYLQGIQCVSTASLRYTNMDCAFRAVVRFNYLELSHIASRLQAKAMCEIRGNKS